MKITFCFNKQRTVINYSCKFSLSSVWTLMMLVLRCGCGLFRYDYRVLPVSYLVQYLILVGHRKYCWNLYYSKLDISGMELKQFCGLHLGNLRSM